MPPTPFHLGPGLLFKSLSPGRISFIGFAATQVVIDLEVLVNLIRGHSPLHGFFHSLLGGLLAGLLVILACLLLRSRFIRSIENLPSILREDVSPAGIVLGSILGGLSHSLLDNIVHRDAHLFFPLEGIFSANGLVEYHSLIVICGASGVFGLTIFIARRYHRMTI